jgi:predicted TIM-barrel fold metal-dependent hydrolase
MIIDAHVHLMEPERGATGYDYLKKTDGAWGQVWDAARLVGLLDECGFERAVIFTFAGLYANEEYDLYNENLARQVHRFPDRLFGFGCLDLKTDPHAAAQVPRMVEELGLVGIKFHPWAQRFPANSGLLKPVYEQASHYRLPVLFHTGTPPYSQPAQVAQWAGDYPDVQFIIGHFGKLIWLDAVRAAVQYPNVYLETSGAQVSDIEIAVELLGEDRIVFGTDLPIGGAAAGKWNVAKIDAARISEGAKKRILGQNILDILGRVTVAGGTSR